MRFHGTLRMLFQPEVLELWLLRQGVLVKEFKPFALALTTLAVVAALGLVAAVLIPRQVGETSGITR